MLGLSWPIFGLYWPRSRILTPFEKHAKTQDSRAKMPPPKLKLISYNAIANGSRRHTKNASAPSVRADFGWFWHVPLSTASVQPDMKWCCFYSSLWETFHVQCIHGRVRLLDSAHPCRLGENHGQGNPLQAGVFAAKAGSNERPQGECADSGIIHRLESLLFGDHAATKKEVKALMPQHASNTASWPQVSEGIPHDTTSHHIPCHPVWQNRDFMICRNWLT